ncbi:acetylcholine receptor subunit alpha-like [Rhipicephalus sanguineus]|uniref:acetylcholine receptor subunit alpha-like n=1 Tax=Rhipicephalus sanguineus TaxID=34632 RepID=UPI00189410DF|nr:acetylcholine receptor subunit alpha-like [Rhipicephalus sanguineus]
MDLQPPGIRLVRLLLLALAIGVRGSPDAKRLYDDLISRYNKLVRPVVNDTDALTVRIKLKLSQLIEVNLKNQIMTTNLWVEQYWDDYKLSWDPRDYGGVDMLHVPSDHIWRPDIVLYNNADGNFEVTLSTKAQLNYTGRIQWKPPAIYKSSCEIDVEFFPFDEQTCLMKFGSWTYDGFKVDLRHVDEVQNQSLVEIGVDLTEFYLSVEWDILEVPAVRHEKYYTCCEHPYIDITFNISMRRKTLFYTVNLIVPCMGISFLTVLVFYLPSDSGEKVALSISILLSLTVFFLLLAEIIPPASLVVPLLGKYLLFTMVLVTLSICVTVVVLNVHFRTSSTHRMAPWVKKVFLQILPRLLGIPRPAQEDPLFKLVVPSCNGTDSTRDPYATASTSASPGPGFEEGVYEREEDPIVCKVHGLRRTASETFADYAAEPSSAGHRRPSPPSPLVGGAPGMRLHFCPELQRALESVHFIADHTRRYEDHLEVKEDWKYVAMVLDRLFLWIFTAAVIVGTCAIILDAPTLYDTREPIDVRLSEVLSVLYKGHQS